MDDGLKTMHITMERLYGAIKKDDGQKYSQTEMAAKLNQSSQVVKNWETRGISADGLILCQHKLGVSCTWLLHGEGHPLLPKLENISVAGITIDSFDAQLNKHFQLLSDAHKDAVLMLVNKLYSIDNPEDSKATGRKNGNKKVSQ